MSVLALMRTSDDRLWGRLLEWQPPRWFRAWMLTASRLADGWLWPVTAVLLVADGRRGLGVLVAGAVSALVANAMLVLAKGRVPAQPPLRAGEASRFRGRPAHLVRLRPLLLPLGPRVERVRRGFGGRPRLPLGRAARVSPGGQHRGVPRRAGTALAERRARGRAGWRRHRHRHLPRPAPVAPAGRPPTSTCPRSPRRPAHTE